MRSGTFAGQMQIHFFDTIQLKEKEFEAETKNARFQEAMILDIFNIVKEATPFEISKLLNEIKKDWPITSIRRAITVLSKRGKLQKTETMRIGEYGKPNHVWRIVE